MLCEQVLGKLNEFDTTGKEIETVDIEWHEAFKRIHKKNTDKGTEVGIRMDDSILSRGLYQDDVIYADDEKLYKNRGRAAIYAALFSNFIYQSTFTTDDGNLPLRHCSTPFSFIYFFFCT